MRKILLSLLTICFLGTTASAQVAQQVAGLYHGELIISFEPINDESEVLYNQTVELSAADDNTVDFLLSDFNFNDAPMGDISIPAIGVSEDGTKVTFGERAPVDLVMGGGLIEATAQIDAASSYIEGDEIYVDLNILWTNTGADAVPIYVRFTGARLTPIDPSVYCDTYKAYIGVLDETFNNYSDILYGITGELSMQADSTMSATIHNFERDGVNWGSFTFSGLHMGCKKELNIITENADTTVTLPDGKTAKFHLYGDLGMSYYFWWEREGYGDCFLITFAYTYDGKTEYMHWVGVKDHPIDTGIHTPALRPAATGVYSIDGRYMGNSLDHLGRGVYIVGGKKVYKK